MENNGPGMSLIVKTVSRLTVGLILIYGIYVALEGHIGCGSGFAGGIIIALSFIHLMLAFGKEIALKKLDKKEGIFLASSGALIFGLVATARFLLGAFYRDTAFLTELAMALMAGTGLFVIFLALVLSQEPRHEQ